MALTSQQEIPLDLLVDLQLFFQAIPEEGHLYVCVLKQIYMFFTSTVTYECYRYEFILSQSN